MNWFEKIVAALDGNMTTPPAYGLWHIISTLIMIVCIVLVCVFCRKLSDKAFRIIIGVLSGVILIFEVLKQVTLSYNPSSDTWDYQWYMFPFQFCSAPNYVLPIIALLKPCKFRDFLCSFMATFALFAGLAVMVLPSDVFCGSIIINIQTMVHHGLMVVVGIFMYVSKNAQIKHTTILKGMAVFSVIVGLALIMNVLFHYFGNGETFNMFYISPYGVCHMPILDIINANAPYVVFLISYILGFSLCGYIILLIAMLINLVVKSIRNKSEKLISIC